MRHERQLAPVNRVPQAGQASNSASPALMRMRASCRNARAVVTACAADYHLRMPASASRDFRLIDRTGPGQRAVMRNAAEGRSDFLVISGFRGSPLPDTITNPRMETRGGPESWRMVGSQGTFDFEARAVDEIEIQPALYQELHRPFVLTTGDRFAVRCLLALLRLPGGARLLRLWHASRSA